MYIHGRLTLLERLVKTAGRGDFIRKLLPSVEFEPHGVESITKMDPYNSILVDNRKSLAANARYARATGQNFSGEGLADVLPSLRDPSWEYRPSAERSAVIRGGLHSNPTSADEVMHNQRAPAPAQINEAAWHPGLGTMGVGAVGLGSLGWLALHKNKNQQQQQQSAQQPIQQR